MEKEKIDSYDKAIEDAVELMDNGCALSDEEIARMMSDEDVVEAFSDLLDVKRATLSRSSQSCCCIYPAIHVCCTRIRRYISGS